MHLPTTSQVAIASYTFLSFFAGTTNAAGIKVNYYSDTNCKNYMISVRPTDNESCYDYGWTGQQSVGIAECTYSQDGCRCDFYQEYGCTGRKVTKTYKVVEPNWCASNPGPGFKSMRCKRFSTGV